MSLRMKSLLCAAMVTTLTGASLGSENEVRRTNFNATRRGVSPVGISYRSRPLRQLFMNHQSRISSVQLQFGGDVPAELMSDEVHLKILDGCLRPVAEAVAPIDTSNLTSPGASTWVDVPVDARLHHGHYYYLEVWTRYGNRTNGGRLLSNENAYEHGRLFESPTLTFPDKKRDLMFILHGFADPASRMYPMATTNVLCPSRCQPLKPEVSRWGSRNQFNVLVQEFGSAGPVGSFWGEDVGGLRDDLLRLIEGEPSNPGLNGTVPYHRFYADMNFYIALEDPAATVGSHKGMLYCANVDAALRIYTDGIPYGPYAYGGGSFTGGVPRPDADDPADVDWPADQRKTMVHELFGHGVAALSDEYLGSASGAAVSLFTPNSAPIGCPGWCDGFRPLAEIQHEMQVRGDKDSPCWEYQEAQCRSSDSRRRDEPSCRWIGDLPAIPYFAGNGARCIPHSIKDYQMGIGCSGNAGCYIGAPHGPTGGAYLNVAQPNSSIMMSFRPNPAPGFTTPIEQHIESVMKCMFSTSCYGYDAVACEAFQQKWGSPGSANRSFAESANACDGRRYQRR